MGKSYYIFSALYFPSTYGVERYTYNIAKKLIERGNKVTVITSNVFNLQDYEVSEDIAIYRLPCFKLLKGRFPVLKLNKKCLTIIKDLKKNKVDFVIVNTRFYPHSLFGVRFAKKIKSRCILIEHGTSHVSINNKLMDNIGKVYEHFITFLIKQNCKEFYGVSEACNNWLEHFNIKAKSTIYNSIDMENINNIINDSKSNIRNKYNLTENDILITFAGRLVKEKGILNLMNAVVEINKKYSNVYLFIAGEGNLIDEIKKVKTKNIFVLGKISFEKVIELLKQSDIFCLPSDSEGFPTSVLEAAACKSFVITTKNGGAKELIINDDYGIIMQSNSTNEIYDSIIKAIENREWAESAVEKTYNRLIQNFTWDKAADKIVQIGGEK